jgi:protein TonB
MTPDFLARLGLSVEADERAIRRAYARELKLIDQDADPAGFQVLREAYETATAWAQHRVRVQAQAAVAVEADVPPELAGAGSMAAADDGESRPGRASAAALEGSMEGAIPALRAAPLAAHQSPAQAEASDVGDTCVLLEDGAAATESQPSAEAAPKAPTAYSISVEVMCELLDAQRTTAQREPELAQRAWKAALQGALQDERLLPLDVRQHFEFVVLDYLSSAWQPSHPDVLHAAAQVFEWEIDRARLRVFGSYGEVVDQALQQRHVLGSLGAAETRLQAQVLAYLRAEQLPDRKQLAVLYPCLYRMRAQAPEYVQLVVNPEGAAQWQAAYEQFGLRDPATVLPPDDQPAETAESSDRNYSLGWMLVFCIIMVLKFVWNALPGDDRPPPRPDPVIQTGPTAEQLSDIQSRIQYQPKFKGKKEVELVAEYLVHINSIGKVSPAFLTKSSGDPDYDAAVEQALLDARPFPHTTKREFSIQISMRYSWSSNAPAVQAPQPAASPPALPVSQLSDEELNEIGKRIFFTHHGEEDIGTAAYRVKLDAQGRIVALDKSKASNQPGFDEAVKNAILSMDPFTTGRGATFSVSFSRRTKKAPRPANSEEDKDPEPAQPSGPSINDTAPGNAP